MENNSTAVVQDKNIAKAIVSAAILLILGVSMGRCSNESALMNEFKKQNKDLFVKDSNNIEKYIPKKQADSIYDFSIYFEEINENRKPVLTSDKKEIIGYTY